jgi:hypothetical protein
MVFFYIIFESAMFVGLFTLIEKIKGSYLVFLTIFKTADVKDARSRPNPEVKKSETAGGMYHPTVG